MVNATHTRYGRTSPRPTAYIAPATIRSVRAISFRDHTPAWEWRLTVPGAEPPNDDLTIVTLLTEAAMPHVARFVQAANPTALNLHVSYDPGPFALTGKWLRVVFVGGEPRGLLPIQSR